MDPVYPQTVHVVADVTTEPTLQIGVPRVLFRAQFARIQGKNYDVTPDGRRFLMVESVDSAPPREVTVILNRMEDVKSRLRSK